MTISGEFFNGNDAYDYEQYLIYENWNNPLLINDSCYHGKLRFKRSAESIKAQMGKSPNNIKPITQIVKDTGKILNINYKIIPNYRLKYLVLFHGFKLAFLTKKEQIDFIKNNPHFKLFHLPDSAKSILSKQQTGTLKPRTAEHTANWIKAYPKTNANKGIPKKREAIINNQKARRNTYQKILDNIDLESLIRFITIDRLSQKEISLKMNLKHGQIKRKLKSVGLNLDEYLEENHRSSSGINRKLKNHQR